MAYDPKERRPPVLALNAIRIVTPRTHLPAAVLPYTREALLACLDSEKQDVFATRHGENDMAVVPLGPDAVLPGARLGLLAHENMRLVSALAREAVFRLLVRLGPQGYRVTRRRPPTVEAAKLENVIPRDLHLPDWLKKRVVLEFETRILHPRGAPPYVVLTCSKRLRTAIAASCAELHGLGVPLIGSAATSYVEDPDPRVSARLRYAGRVTDVVDGTVALEDQGDGPERVPAGQLFLDPVLLRLHDLSTYRDMGVLARQVSDFAMHSWRTFGAARLPISLGYANEIARQLAGLERTPNWDEDAVEGSRVMRRPWFL